METQIYLTDLFLDNGNIIPFVFKNETLEKNNITYQLTAGIFDSNDKTISLNNESRFFHGETSNELVEEDSKSIVEFYAKKLLAAVIEADFDLKIEADFELKPCSFNKFMILTAAEMEDDQLSEFGLFLPKYQDLLERYRYFVTRDPISPLNKWKIKDSGS